MNCETNAQGQHGRGKVKRGKRGGLSTECVACCHVVIMYQLRSNTRRSCLQVDNNSALETESTRLPPLELFGGKLQHERSRVTGVHTAMFIQEADLPTCRFDKRKWFAASAP